MRFGFGFRTGHRTGGGNGSAPNIPVPSNNKVAIWLDSRSAQATSTTAFVNTNTRTINRGTSYAPNVFAIDPRLELADDSINTLGTEYSGGRTDWTANTAYMSNFGISGDRVDTAYTADPRTTKTFTGTISGTTLTVTGASSNGNGIAIGATIKGVGVTVGTKITALAGGTTGGNGTYTVDTSQTVGPAAMQTVSTAGTELSFAALRQSTAGIVIALGGVNNMKASWLATDTYAHMKNAVADLTNPSLNGGLQRVVVLLDELPYGVYPGGGTGANTPTSPQRAEMASYSLLLRRLSYNSGHEDSNPYCIVVNVYDWATGGVGGAVGNLDGLLYDGLHAGSAGGPLIAQQVATQLAPMLTAAGFSDTITPQLATSNSFTGLLNNSPVLAGAAGSAGSGITLLSGQIPSGWALVRGSATGNVNVTITYPSAGRIRMVMSWSGIPAAGDSLQLRQLGVGSISIGETAQGFMKCRFDTGSVNFFGVGMRAFLVSNPTGKGWTAGNELGATSAFGGVANSGVCDAGGIETFLKTQPLKTSRMTADSVVPNGFNFYAMAFMNGTDGGAAVEIEKPTLRKI